MFKVNNKNTRIKDHTYFNKPATKKLQVCLGRYDILLPPCIKDTVKAYFY